MDAEQTQEKWQVEANGSIYDTSFVEMTSWIDQGSLFRQDKVRKGNLRWIEAGKVPSLVAVFNAKENGQPLPPPVVTTTKLQPTTMPGDPIARTANYVPAEIHNSSADFETIHSDVPVCIVHAEVLAAYVCGTCFSNFCKGCPNSYGGSVKICPYCGAMCKSLAQIQKVQNETHLHSSFSGRGFGFADLAKALAYPFKFKTSLIIGALMYMFFTLGQSAMGFGGIFMLSGAIVSFMLANTLTFGVLSNTVENFAQGKLGLNFMPTFDDFSIWDDVVHPFFLMIGVYISSFGPTLVLVIAAFFFISSSASNEMNGFEADAARAVNPELPYAANAAKQSEQVRELLRKQADDQKRRIDAMDDRETQPDVSLNREGAKDPDELKIEKMSEMIQQQRKAQLESAVGKTPETVAQERAAMIKKVIGYGFVFMALLSISLLWGLFYYPAACAVAGYTQSFGATINPLVGIDTIRRLGFDYVKILSMVILIGVMSGFIFGIISMILSPFDMPGVGNIPAKAIGSLFGFYFSVVFACIVGFALYKAADRLKLPGA